MNQQGSESDSQDQRDVTRLIQAADEGDQVAAGDLLRLIYQDLKRVAQAKLRNERVEHTLQATDLVHEAYLRLVKPGEKQDWENRTHFFSAAAETMRRVLIDHARQKKSQKRGGDWGRVPFPEDWIPNEKRADELLQLEAALQEFEKVEPDKTSLVKLRYFARLTNAEAAAALGISTATAERHWRFARAWLKDAMGS